MINVRIDFVNIVQVVSFMKKLLCVNEMHSYEG